MTRTTKENIRISLEIEKVLEITFDNEEFPLGNWGAVDNWCEIGYNKLVLLECERTQKHPTTNVLKLYPYLEEFPLVHVILIHYFFPENEAPKSRVALCDFIGAKMESELGIRFQYVPLRCEEKLIGEELKKHNRRLMQVFPSITGK